MPPQTRIFYSGMVQGVGFRYTTCRYARQLGLCGWVRNLADGRVEVLLQGEPQALEALQQNLQDHFGGYIRAQESFLEDREEVLSDFFIREG